MRCAYLILAHRYPDQLARLVAALTLPEEARKDGDQAYIHLDRRANLAEFRATMEQAGLREGYTHQFIAEREHAIWGDYSLVQASLNLIRACHSNGVSKVSAGLAGYDYLSLVSGQDYPLTGATERKRRLITTSGAEHLSYFTLPYEGWAMNGGMDRVRKYHIPGLRERVRVSGVPGARYIGAGLALALSLLPRPTAVPGGVTVLGGWQWWTLTANCARYVLAAAERDRALVRYFRYSLIPDELFFQTIIMNSPFASSVTGDYLRFIEWNGVKPEVFGLGDLPRLLNAAETCLFARKFDVGQVGTNALLDALDLAAGEDRNGTRGNRLAAAGQSYS